MAAVAISPSPHAIGSMASRRAPLSNLPNAPNSPFRGFAASSKRAHAQHDATDEPAYGQPPSKRQALEVGPSAPRTPTKKQIQPVSCTKRELERRLRAARERPTTSRAARQGKEKPEAEAEAWTQENLKQWQRHYRKAFPAYVFYFENVSEDSRRQFTKAISALGAKDAKFFSKEVTHVITTRALPTDADAKGNSEENPTSSASALRAEAVPPRTINPSLLEKNSDLGDGPLRGKFPSESTSSKKPPSGAQARDMQKSSAGGVDVLQRAKALEMKVWQLEKLRRIIITMFEDSEEQQDPVALNNIAKTAAKSGQKADLSQMIKNESLQNANDRETSLRTEIVPLKAPYIYVRCMNEKTKPIMLREYPKPQKPEDGEWPQFRSTSMGKCPFVDEDSMQRKAEETAKEEVAAKERVVKQDRAQAKLSTREASLRRAQNPFRQPQTQTMNPPATKASTKQPLAETAHGANAIVHLANILPPPPSVVSTAHHHLSKPSTSTTAPTSTTTLPPNARNNSTAFPRNGNEPMASGMQASNITSAIRSQMISSTAAAPGAKAGTSREMHGLQRKVLERNSGAPAPALGMTSAGVAGPFEAAPARIRGEAEGKVGTEEVGNAVPARTVRGEARAAKMRAQERLGGKMVVIAEDEDVSDDEDYADRGGRRANSVSALASKKSRKDSKPGYCENCREKFEDFDEHTNGRRHRKFATGKENWKDLDRLLAALQRPLR